MLINQLLTKWIARSLVFVFLFLVSGSGNTTFWCLAEESTSHLEANLNGSCMFSCQTVVEAAQAKVPAPAHQTSIESGQEDCIDTPMYSSTTTSPVRKILKDKLPVTYLDKSDSQPVQIDRLNKLANSFFAEKNQTPRQALTSLSTVTLLC